jgi:hypothetical protein
MLQNRKELQDFNKILDIIERKSEAKKAKRLQGGTIGSKKR